MKNWKESLLAPDNTIKDAMRQMNETGIPVGLVVDSKGNLLGVVTDGDIRRSLLNNPSMSEPISVAMNTNPKTCEVDTPVEFTKNLFSQFGIQHLPVVDKEGIVFGLRSFNESVKKDKLNNTVFLLAGGIGSRLKPLTDDVPKPLLNVGSQPILENIIKSFIGYGFYKFCISVNYKSEKIKDYFGDGSKWGISINYLEEEKRLGTAGALSLLDMSEIKEPIIVMNGDLLTNVNYGNLLEFHNEKESEATICVRSFDYEIPYGVVEAEDHRMIKIMEKPSHSVFINAGIYVLNPEMIKKIPSDEYFEMTTLFENAKNEDKEVVVFPIYEYWLDIGQHEDFKRAQKDVKLYFPE